MGSDNRIFVLSVVFLSVLTLFLLINFGGAVITVVSPLNGTNYTGSALFNVSFLNSTDINFSAYTQYALNATFFRVDGATRTLIGNSSTCASSGQDSGGRNITSCWGILNFTSTADGLFNITAEIRNATIILNASINTTNVRLDSSPPNVDVTNFSGLNSGQNNSRVISLNVSITDNGVGIQTVYFNITNSSGVQNFTINANNFGNRWNATINTSNFLNGVYNITVYANDTLNNLNSSARVFSVIFDNSIPASVNFTSITSGYNITGNNFIVNMSISDINSAIGAVMLNITNSTGVQNSTIFASLETGNIWVALINTTWYPDGLYNITIYANDTAGNQNTSAIVRSVAFDNTAPSVSLSCTPNPVVIGYVVTCSFSANDSISGIRSSSYTVNPSTADIGQKTTSGTATNYANISTTVSYTYTVNSAGGNEGGTSGAGTTPTVSDSTGKRQGLFSVINPETPQKFSISDNSFGVKSIEIFVNNKAQDVEINVNKFDGKPALVSVAKNGKVYKYLEISAKNLGTKINKAKLTVQVEKSWVTQNSLDKDKLAVYRLVNSAWTELPTTFSSEEGNDYVYEAETPGFSFFAIAQKSVVDTTSGAGTNNGGNVTAGNGTSSGTEGKKSNSTMWWIVGIIIVLIAILIIYFVKRK